MRTEDYEYLYRLEENFWWFIGMREITAAPLDPFLPPGARLILDAGFGTGGNLEWLARYAGSGRIVGIDLISTAIEFCRKRNYERLVQASVTDLPFADESFDLITSFDALAQNPGRGADERG
jgi:ubiquinone/menaquinone biosynthesis C-methylase UbiE